VANLRLPGRSALTLAPPLSTKNIRARTKPAPATSSPHAFPCGRSMSYPSRGPSVQIVDRAGAPWPAHRLPRRRLRSAPSPRRCKPGDTQTPFPNPRAVSGSLLPESFPNRILLWIHHIHPIRCHHIAPTHLQNRPPSSSLSRPVEDCEECPALAGVRNLGLDDPSADRPIKHCNFGDRSIQVLPRLQHVEGRDGYLRSVHRAAAPASGSCSPARWADR
jgi:hypothetical protein